MGGVDNVKQSAVKLDSGQKRVRLKGDIDHHSADGLREKLDKLIDREMPECLILDFSEVGLMDSSGIGLILGRYKKLKARGGRLCVCNLSRQMDLVFRVSGLYQVIGKVK